MTLPVVKYPTFELTVPSTKKVIKYRPFLVREHKLILQALELKDSANFINTIYKIIEACTFGKVDVEKLAMYDIDYIFLMIRARSIGELIPVEYRCAAEIKKVLEDGTETIEPCNTKVRVNLDLNQIKVHVPEDYEKNRIIIADASSNIGLKMRAPTFAQFRELSNIENVEGLFNVTEAFVYSCTECVFEGDNVLVPGKDFTQEELTEFIEGLHGDVIEKINDFFTNMPYVALNTKIRCPKCGNEDEIEIRSLEDFFV
jgi:hypothetical protein